MRHMEADVAFPFRQFPPLKYAIAYGSFYLPPTKASRILPSLPDFILVIDDSKCSVAQWHRENQMRNRQHYSSLTRSLTRSGRLLASFQEMAPGAYFSPLSIMHFPSRAPGGLPKMTKYMVTTESTLLNDLREWSDFFFAGRLQKPTLIIHPTHDGLITSKTAQPSHALDSSSPLDAAIKRNLLNALRTALLCSDRHMSLRDLLRTTALLSFSGDNRCRIFNETYKARSNVTNNFLSFLHLYAPLLPELRDKWRIQLEEGDEDILNGRYTPRPFREGGKSKAKDPAAVSGKFELQFENPADEKLVAEILEKTREPLADHVKETFAARLMGDNMPHLLKADLLEAAQTLVSRELPLRQSYSSEAHCSLFHSLPDALQVRAVGASARSRLNRIFNPFYLLDCTTDRDILGGPLPWEKCCVETGLSKLVGRSARRACIKGVGMAGLTRAGFYTFQKWCGHVSV